MLKRDTAMKPKTDETKITCNIVHFYEKRISPYYSPRNCLTLLFKILEIEIHTIDHQILDNLNIKIQSLGLPSFFPKTVASNMLHRIRWALEACIKRLSVRASLESDPQDDVQHLRFLKDIQTFLLEKSWLNHIQRVEEESKFNYFECDMQTSILAYLQVLKAIAKKNESSAILKKVSFLKKMEKEVKNTKFPNAYLEPKRSIPQALKIMRTASSEPEIWETITASTSEISTLSSQIETAIYQLCDPRYFFLRCWKFDVSQNFLATEHSVSDPRNIFRIFISLFTSFYVVICNKKKNATLAQIKSLESKISEIMFPPVIQGAGHRIVEILQTSLTVIVDSLKDFKNILTLLHFILENEAFQEYVHFMVMNILLKQSILTPHSNIDIRTSRVVTKNYAPKQYIHYLLYLIENYTVFGSRETGKFANWAKQIQDEEFSISIPDEISSQRADKIILWVLNQWLKILASQEFASGSSPATKYSEWKQIKDWFDEDMLDWLIHEKTIDVWISEEKRNSQTRKIRKKGWQLNTSTQQLEEAKNPVIDHKISPKDYLYYCLNLIKSGMEADKCRFWNIGSLQAKIDADTTLPSSFPQEMSNQSVKEKMLWVLGEWLKILEGHGGGSGNSGTGYNRWMGIKEFVTSGADSLLKQAEISYTGPYPTSLVPPTTPKEKEATELEIKKDELELEIDFLDILGNQPPQTKGFSSESSDKKHTGQLTSQPIELEVDSLMQELSLEGPTSAPTPRTIPQPKVSDSDLYRLIGKSQPPRIALSPEELNLQVLATRAQLQNRFGSGSSQWSGS